MIDCEAKDFTDYDMLDASALRKIISSVHFRKRVQLELVKQNEDSQTCSQKVYRMTMSKIST